MARIIELIYTEVPRGKGTEDDIARLVKQLWSKDGHLIAEQDMDGMIFNGNLLQDLD